jgi:hypothetical protein
MQSIRQWPVRNGISLFARIDTKPIEQLSECRRIDYISLSHQIPAADAPAIFRPAAFQTCVNRGSCFAIIANCLIPYLHPCHRHSSIVIQTVHVANTDLLALLASPAVFFERGRERREAQ